MFGNTGGLRGQTYGALGHTASTSYNPDLPIPMTLYLSYCSELQVFSDVDLGTFYLIFKKTSLHLTSSYPQEHLSRPHVSSPVRFSGSSGSVCKSAACVMFTDP